MDSPSIDRPALHGALDGLAGLLGTWEGTGEGSYPTIESFGYREQVVFGHNGKPFLTYVQRTWALDDGRPLHAETGYLRLIDGERLEFVLAHPTGLAELAEGRLHRDGDAVELSLESTAVIGSTTAVEVSQVRRTIRLVGDSLSYDLAMAAVGQPLTHHLSAFLDRRTTS